MEPSEINLLVLRHLAREGCFETIRCYTSESSSVKEFLSSNGNLDSIDAVRQKLQSTSLQGGLIDVLSDYGRAKLLMIDLVTKLLDTKVISPYYISPYDTLSTQLVYISKFLLSKCKEIATEDKNVGTTDFLEFVPSTSSIQPSQIEKAVIINDSTISTNCTVQPREREREPPEEHLPNFATFMEEPVLNQIVSIANKSLQRGTQQSVENVPGSDCNTETDIDKMLVDILCGISGEPLSKAILDGNQGSINRESNSTEPSNFMTLFQDAQSIIEDTPMTLSHIRPEDSISKQTNGSLVDFLETPNKFNFSSSIYTPISKSSATKKNEMMNNSTLESSHSQAGSSQSGNETITPQQPQPSSSFIKSTSLRNNSPNKVKNYSIISTSSTTSDPHSNLWKKKLHRREITPKIVVNNRLMTLRNETPNKRKARLLSPVKLTPEKALDTDLNFMCVQSGRHAKDQVQRINRSVSAAENSRSGGGDVEDEIDVIDVESELSLPPPTVLPTNSPKRFSTINYNDLCNSDKKQNISSDQSMNESSPFTATTSKNVLNPVQNKVQPTSVVPAAELLQLQEASKTTPITNQSGGENQMLANSSGGKISGRLLASARCSRQNTLSILDKKSYSTPRKKKHIRNLLFKTPPGGRSERIENNVQRSATKRKSDLIPDFKSKKRLTWSTLNTVETPLAPIPEVVVPPPVSTTSSVVPQSTSRKAGSLANLSFKELAEKLKISKAGGNNERKSLPKKTENDSFTKSQPKKTENDSFTKSQPKKTENDSFTKSKNTTNNKEKLENNSRKEQPSRQCKSLKKDKDSTTPPSISPSVSVSSSKRKTRQQLSNDNMAAKAASVNAVPLGNIASNVSEKLVQSTEETSAENKVLSTSTPHPPGSDKSSKFVRQDKIILNVQFSNQTKVPVVSASAVLTPENKQMDATIKNNGSNQVQALAIPIASSHNRFQQQESISSPLKIIRQSPKGTGSSTKKSPLKRILPKPVPADYPKSSFTPILHDQPSEYILSIPSNSPANSRTKPIGSIAATPLKHSSSSGGSASSSWELSTSLPPTPRFVVNNLGDNSQTVDNTDKSRSEMEQSYYPYPFLTSTPFKLGPPRTPGRDISAVVPAILNTDGVFRSSIFDTPLKPLDQTTTNTTTNTTTSLTTGSPSRKSNSISKLIELAKQSQIFQGISSSSNKATNSSISLSETSSSGVTTSKSLLETHSSNKATDTSTSLVVTPSTNKNPGTLKSLVETSSRNKTPNTSTSLVKTPTNNKKPATPKSLVDTCSRNKTTSTSLVKTPTNKKTSTPPVVRTPSIIPTVKKVGSPCKNKSKNFNIQFAVSGRQKSLTMSEHESLIGLLQISNSRPVCTPNPRRGDGSMSNILGDLNVDGFLSSFVHSSV